MTTVPKIRLLCGLLALLFLVLSLFSFIGQSNNGDGIYEELFHECKATAPVQEILTEQDAAIPARVLANAEKQPQLPRSQSMRLQRIAAFLVFSLLGLFCLPSGIRSEFLSVEKAPMCISELLILFEHQSDGKK